MISFDTFLGEAHGVIDEQRDGTIKDDDNGGSVVQRSQRSSRRSSRRRSRRNDMSDNIVTKPAPASSSSSSSYVDDGTDDDMSDASVDFSGARKPPMSSSSRSAAGSGGDSRVQHLFQLLSLKNHTGDARRALVHRLLGVNNVNELVLSKATQDQIASAANDAITDEILATVDQEDKRRKSVCLPPGATVSALEENMALIVAGEGSEAQAVGGAGDGDGASLVSEVGQYSTYRVLELVDVLDSTTGGMVKRILTNVRRRATPLSQQHSVDAPGSTGSGRGFSSASRKTEFCGFCLDYRSHNTTQHKCRVCGALGEHRSQYCTNPKPTATTTPRSRRRGSGGQHTPTQLTPPSSSSSSPAQTTASATATRRSSLDAERSPSTASRLTPDASDKSFCTFCSTWGFHSTENHRCRICGIQGEHRSRHCKKKSSGEGYRWRGSPAEPLPPLSNGDRGKTHCELCGTLRNHSTQEHRCRICLKLGEHRSKNCPMHSPSASPGLSTSAAPGAVTRQTSSSSSSSRGRRTPRSASNYVGSTHSFCSFCGKDVAHKSEEHICRLCRVTGLHRSGDCPSRGIVSSSSQAVLSYSVHTASKVRDRVLESIPLVLPASASTLVFDSIDKVGDVEMILKRTMQRIGVWGGGSQTPITTPYAAPVASSSSSTSRQSFVDASGALVPLAAAPPPALQQVDGLGVYVVSYAEGRSVVPERILKYMRLLMHHEISTNAFSVVVVFDPRPSTWELAKPGMVTPRSLPSSPTMSEQLKKRMAKYTLQTLLGTREKLVKLVVAQKKLQLQQHSNHSHNQELQQQDQARAQAP